MVNRRTPRDDGRRRQQCFGRGSSPSHRVPAQLSKSGDVNAESRSGVVSTGFAKQLSAKRNCSTGTN